jgi:hypothetical protein
MCDFTRLDPPHLQRPKSDHDIAFYYEAVGDDARPHILEASFVPLPRLVMTAQSWAPRGLQLNLGVEQREKLANVAPLVEKLDPSAC